MKNLILATITLLICNIAKSQEYTPFNFEKGIWVNTDWSLVDQQIQYSYQYFCKGDTLIGTVKYFKLYQYEISLTNPGIPDTFPLSYRFAIRNNDKKQVIIDNNIVLYDFNLKIGDTILNGLQYYDENPIVKKIDSILICGKYHKRYKTQYTWYNTYLGFTDTSALIEGIGMNQCLLGVVGINGHDEGGSKGCYTEIGNNSCAKCDLLLSVKNIPDLSDEIKIFPNPGNSKLFISTSKVIRKIFIYNILGQPGYFNDRLNSSTANIDIKSFVAGTYIIKMEFSDKSNAIKPFIKH